MVDSDHKSQKKQRRKAWFEEIRRHAPDTDWQAIERENGQQQIDKRNRLAMGMAGPSGRWTERGSQNQAGRAHVGVHSTLGDALYVGSSRGGIWRGSLDGEEWTPLGDNLYGGAHWLLPMAPINEGDPDTLFVGTGDGLLHYSDDDGQTWNVPAGIPEYTIGNRRTVMTTDGSEAIFAVLRHWSWDDHAYVYSLFRSLDRGESLEQIHAFGVVAGDVWVPRDGSPGLYMADGNAVYISTDLGEQFSVLGDLPAAVGQVEMVGSEAGAPRLWVVLDQSEIYRSDDLADTWTRKGVITDRYMQYWGRLNASMLDVDVFAHGGMEFFSTVDGGDSYTQMNPWGDYYSRPQDRLHADIMGIDVVVDDFGEEIWYIATDGGLYHSLDGLETVENLSLDGLRISQYYDTLTDKYDPDLIAAGSQDQGYQTTGGVGQDDAFMEFDQIISGDYGHLTSHDGTHARVFTNYPGFMGVFEGDAPEWLQAYVDFPAGEQNRTYAWIPPLVADPMDPDAVYACFTRLYRYEWDGEVWSPVLWSAYEFSSSQGEYLSALAFAPSDPERAYAATSTGRLMVSTDRGVNWTMATDDGGPLGNYLYGSVIVVDPGDADVVYVGGSGYDNAPVYRSTDGGESWSDWSEGMPATTVLDLTMAGDGALYAATQTAAYRRAQDGAQWVDITGNEAPVTTYWSVEYVPAAALVRFGTYGRGIWDWHLDGTPDEMDDDNDGVANAADCEPENPAVSPNAEDICEDGVDQNCDGVDATCIVDSGAGGGAVVPEPEESDCGGCASAPLSAPLGGIWVMVLWGMRRRQR